jgi:hypothetical protein
LPTARVAFELVLRHTSPNGAFSPRRTAGRRSSTLLQLG